MVKTHSQYYLRVLVIPLLILNLAVLAGCTGKKKVTFIPQHKRGQTVSEVDTNNQITAKLHQHYAKWSGTRYRSGGYSRDGLDCSGFVKLTYLELFDKRLPRTVDEQSGRGRLVARRNLQPGDLVFFKTGLFQKHVGIYLGRNVFMHVSESKGLTVSELENIYWSGRYWKGQRLL